MNWISVETAIPAKKGIYYVCLRDTYEIPVGPQGIMVYVAAYDGKEWTEVSGEALTEAAVTHWMPHPDLPTK